MSQSRRALLAGGLALLGGAAAPAGHPARAWIVYEARLRARLGDAGGGRFDDGLARGLLERTNRARSAAGAPSVAWHEALAETARAHAADLLQRDYVEHVTPEGFDPTDRLGLLARRLLGSASENIAYRRGELPHTPDDLIGQWRRSAPHWANLRRASHSHVGYGVARMGERTYAVGLYGRPDGELPVPAPFRTSDPRAVARAVEGLSAPFLGFWLEDQVTGGRVSGAHAGPGVYRLRIDRRVREGAFTSLFGPIFVWRDPA